MNNVYSLYRDCQTGHNEIMLHQQITSYIDSDCHEIRCENNFLCNNFNHTI